MDRESTTRLCTGAEGRAGLTVQVIDANRAWEVNYFIFPVGCL